MVFGYNQTFNPQAQPVPDETMKTIRQNILPLIAVLTLVFHGMTLTSSAQETPAALNFTMKSIEGKDVSLSKYAGKVVVLVNVASKCGYTPQYKQLQKLHTDLSGQGVAVIGVPCNQFKGQEPGSDKEILKFCQSKYNVEFDLLSKVDVNGKKQCGLYKHLNALDVASKVKVNSDQFMVALKKAMGDSGHYSHKSEKLGRSYYLFSKEVPLKNSDKVQTIYFFAKDPDNKKGKPLASVPEGKMVSETKTGMLVLKNDGKKKK